MQSLIKRLKGQKSSSAAVTSKTQTLLPKSSVIVPLYIYPQDARSWQPLHAAISSNPSLNFIVIVNPHNGPGEPSLPDEYYSVEIPKLNAHPNVQVIGYVALGYCKRDLATVCQDVTKYAGWSSATAKDATTGREVNRNLGVSGIFFDESPNLYEPQVAVYLKSVTKYVKSTEGICGDRLVIHNPGTVPDPELAVHGPDVTVIVEGTHELYQLEATQERIESLLRYENDRCCFIIHSVPEREVRRLVTELRRRGSYIFVTDLYDNVYCNFGKTWTTFIDAMASDT